MRDSVDDILDQWSALRTDLDLDAMGAVGRIMRLSRFASASIKDYFAQYGMESWEFDVLATLRRSDRALTPKALAASVMIGSAALTNRVDRLVARGLVTRDVIPGNRRSFHISLTAEGRELVDRTVEGHVQNQRKLLAGLGDGDAEELERILRALLVSLGDAR
ncbi:MarR family transcriptional regulator [Streptomyces sp. NPDC093544]|uniref:MarR family winged helix-turn-helix transcriptional regulator n=1 Tax=Streptomyces sp. NPDC093544 TaxID=3155200 RepID=UPI00343A35B4